MDRLSWQEHHMAIATMVALRSPDPNTKVGAVIINTDQRVIATGYNGTPRAIESNKIPWDREAEDKLQTKYPYIIHAEVNAILAAKTDLTGFDLYTTLFPCAECAKLIAQSGIYDLFYHSDKYNGTEDNTIAKKILDMSGIGYYKVKHNKEKIDNLYLNFIEEPHDPL